MRVRLRSTGKVLLLLCGVASGQTPSPVSRPEFEAITIKLNVSGSNELGFDFHPSGIFRSANTPLITLFRFAYDASPLTVSGAPPWFDNDRYDIAAKAAPGAPYSALKLLLQSFFAVQLKMVTHTETRTIHGFSLVVAKSPAKLETSDGTEKSGCVPVGDQGPSAGGRHMQCCMTMEELAHALPSLAPAYFGKPVVDQTHLTGRYDFRLDWVGRTDADAAGGVTIFGAIEKLGLKLVSEKVPVPLIVIDHVERPPLN
jgi:uncharacterized protein (TIGR03435 family)